MKCDHAAVAADVRAGMKRGDIAARHGITPRHVTNIARAAGIRCGARRVYAKGAPRKCAHAAVAADVLAGLRRAEIAAKHGITPRQVTNISRSQGIAPRAGRVSAMAPWPALASEYRRLITVKKFRAAEAASIIKASREWRALEPAA